VPSAIKSPEKAFEIQSEYWYASIIEYQGEVGVGVQHLGVLVGREAHARVWPQIISWLNACSEPTS
jgi:hypothetical protein